MRLDKYLAHTTGLSRKDVRRLLKKGHITADRPLDGPAQTVTPELQLYLDGEPLHYPEPRYFMLHKPIGPVCANSDGEHPIVTDLMDEPDADSLQIAGRLDRDTTGLVILTDDGQWNHRLTAPAQGKIKRYRVTTLTPITDPVIEQFAEGIWLRGEHSPTRPASLERIDEHTAELAISEGRYHQIKRMFAACDNRVTALHRHAMGPIELDPALEPGDYRALTREEIDSV